MSKVTKAQLEQSAKDAFKEVDVNENGKLEKEEVRAFAVFMWKAIQPDQAFDEAAFEASFAQMDKNGDGTVSLEELTADFLQKARE